MTERATCQNQQESADRASVHALVLQLRVVVLQWRINWMTDRIERDRLQRVVDNPWDSSLPALDAWDRAWDFIAKRDRLAKKLKSLEQNANCGGLAPSDLFCGFDPDNLKTMDGYDDCIVGIVERFGQEPIVCYDKEKVIQRLESEGMNRGEAEEFFYFNQIGAWVGEATPCFLSTNK